MKPNIMLKIQKNAAIVFVLVIAAPVTAREAISLGRAHMNDASYAQERRGQSVMVNKDEEFEDRSKSLRLMSERPRKTSPLPPAGQGLAQAQEDFMRLQVVNKSLGQAASANSALDLKFVSNSVSEIKKRAERLKTNLALPEPEKTVERPKVSAVESPEQLKSSILELGKLVRSFVTNPCFKQISVVIDTQLTAKARLDLESIIELSKQLKKDSEKLERASQQKSP
jgi:hypothetical protein